MSNDICHRSRRAGGSVGVVALHVRGAGCAMERSFRMPLGRWAGPDWLLGLAGPYFQEDTPFGGPAGAFSRAGDKAGTTSPRDLVNWFVGLVLGADTQPAAEADERRSGDRDALPKTSGR